MELRTNSTVGNYSYTYDDNDNKTAETITGAMSGYGFTTSLSNSGGNITERYHYTPYGDTTITDAAGTTTRTTSNVGNSYSYTGRRLDGESGLHYFRARYLHEVCGRFCGRDFLQYHPSLNLYVAGFVPYMTDPSGYLTSFDGNIDDTVGMPWSQSDLEGLGATVPDFDVSCSCHGCSIDCKVTLRLFILLDPNAIEDASIEFSDIYGHEQQHVENWLEYAEDTLLPQIESDTEGRFCGPGDDAEQIENDLNEKFEEMLGDFGRREAKHLNPGPPKDRQQFPPREGRMGPPVPLPDWVREELDSRREGIQGNN